jgi:hypothetical protein
MNENDGNIDLPALIIRLFVEEDKDQRIIVEELIYNCQRRPGFCEALQVSLL